MESYEAIGRVEAGRLQIDRGAMRQALAQWEGKTVRVTVKRDRPTRSDQQNKYLWFAYGLLEESTGQPAEDFHHAAKLKFLPKSVALSDGNGVVVDEFVVGGSTTKLSTVEFNDYTAKLREWAREFFNVLIPEPNEAP